MTFFLSKWGYLEKNTEMFIAQSSTFHLLFFHIAEFDWLPGRQKRVNFRKNVKKKYSS